MNADATPSPNEDPLCGNRASGLFRFALDLTVPTPHGQHWQPPTPEHLAALLPQYRITGLLGRGGMGAVYQGIQASLNRPVAIKLLPAELAVNTEFITRFQREAQTLAQLQHPGIVAVHDFGQTSEGHLYFIMEFVNGTDLQQIIHGVGLEPKQALELTIQICEALHFAHSQGVIHRDIKPANVLVTKDGRAKLADFGLARPLTGTDGSVTAASLVMGTPDYMAPEQWTGKADHRADIYSLGVMLYEMLTGQRPQGAFDLPSQRVKTDVRLDEVVIKAMRQEPNRRYQQVSEFRQAVEHIRTTDLPKAASPPQQETPKRTHVRLSNSPQTSAQTSAQPARAISPPVNKRQASHLAPIIWAAVLLLLFGLSYAALLLVRGEKPPQATGASEAERPSSTPVEKAQPSSSSRVTVATVDSPTTSASSSPAPEIRPGGPPATAVALSPVSSNPSPAAPLISPHLAAPGRPPLINIFSTEAQNALVWVMAPLDETVPADIRQNLTYLREDLIDEGKAKPAASLDAYRAAYFLCEAMLAALKEREGARVAAGYRAAQSLANQVNTNEALEVRRNYMMSWPQHARETDQRAELQRQSASNVVLAGEAQKVAWAARAEKLRGNLDGLYRQFRAAMR